MILGALTLDLFSVLFGGAVALLPVFAAEILHVGPQGLGILRAAPAVGAVLMSLVLAHRPPLRRAGRTLLVSVALFGLSMIGFGLSRTSSCRLALLAVSGMADTVSVVIRSTLLQVLTPDHLLGRVASVNAIFIGSSNELGAFESGTAARLIGTVPSVVLGGWLTLVVVAITASRTGRFGSCASWSVLIESSVHCKARLRFLSQQFGEASESLVQFVSRQCGTKAHPHCVGRAFLPTMNSSALFTTTPRSRARATNVSVRHGSGSGSPTDGSTVQRCGEPGPQDLPRQRVARGSISVRFHSDHSAASRSRSSRSRSPPTRER